MHSCFLALDPLIALGESALRARCHGVMPACCHAASSSRATRGQQEGEKRTKDKRTAGSGGQAVQQEDKRRTTGRQEEDKKRKREKYTSIGSIGPKQFQNDSMGPIFVKNDFGTPYLPPESKLLNQ